MEGPAGFCFFELILEKLEPLGNNPLRIPEKQDQPWFVAFFQAGYKIVEVHGSSKRRCRAQGSRRQVKIESFRLAWPLELVPGTLLDVSLERHAGNRRAHGHGK